MSEATADEVMEDWGMSRAPRDPYDDLGVLTREIGRLRELSDDWERRYHAVMQRWGEETSAYRQAIEEVLMAMLDARGPMTEQAALERLAMHVGGEIRAGEVVEWAVDGGRVQREGGVLSLTNPYEFQPWRHRALTR